MATPTYHAYITTHLPEITTLQHEMDLLDNMEEWDYNDTLQQQELLYEAMKHINNLVKIYKEDR
jgi:hypothetical protein